MKRETRDERRKTWVGARAATLLTAFKRIVGMPNYSAYVAHLRERHPECVVPTEREYYELYLQGKYGGGVGSRCC